MSAASYPPVGWPGDYWLRKARAFLAAQGDVCELEQITRDHEEMSATARSLCEELLRSRAGSARFTQMTETTHRLMKHAALLRAVRYLSAASPRSF